MSMEKDKEIELLRDKALASLRSRHPGKFFSAHQIFKEMKRLEQGDVDYLGFIFGMNNGK